jgi:valyl-tRNA synthetase
MIDLQKEILRLEKQLEKEIKSCTSLESKLSSEGFVAKAKPEFIVETNNQLNAKKMNAKALEKRITELRKLFEGN